MRVLFNSNSDDGDDNDDGDGSNSGGSGDNNGGNNGDDRGTYSLEGHMQALSLTPS